MPRLSHDNAPALSPFPPIADYAFLSDCEVSALVAPGGRVEWMCLPRMDGPSVFGALLDRDAGGFRVSPAGERVPAGRRRLRHGGDLSAERRHRPQHRHLIPPRLSRPRRSSTRARGRR